MGWIMLVIFQCEGDELLYCLAYFYNTYAGRIFDCKKEKVTTGICLGATPTYGYHMV